jgi:hypothetical protein
VVSSPPASEDTGALGREIEYRDEYRDVIAFYAAKNNISTTKQPSLGPALPVQGHGFVL